MTFLLADVDRGGWARPVEASSREEAARAADALSVETGRRIVAATEDGEIVHEARGGRR